MWHQIVQMASPLLHHVNRLNRQEWIMLFVVALVLGAYCMRGFGSRANY